MNRAHHAIVLSGAPPSGPEAAASGRRRAPSAAVRQVPCRFGGRMRRPVSSPRACARPGRGRPSRARPAGAPSWARCNEVAAHPARLGAQAAQADDLALVEVAVDLHHPDVVVDLDFGRPLVYLQRAPRRPARVARVAARGSRAGDCGERERGGEREQARAKHNVEEQRHTTFRGARAGCRYITGGWQVIIPSKSARQVVDGGQLGKPVSQKNSHTREFAGEIWYSRPQVGAVPAGPPLHTAPSVVQVLVQRFRPCSAPTLTHTSPAAHCGSPCARRARTTARTRASRPGCRSRRQSTRRPTFRCCCNRAPRQQQGTLPPRLSVHARSIARFAPSAPLLGRRPGHFFFGCLRCFTGCGTHRGRHPASRPGPPRSVASGANGGQSAFELLERACVALGLRRGGRGRQLPRERQPRQQCTSTTVAQKAAPSAASPATRSQRRTRLSPMMAVPSSRTL